MGRHATYGPARTQVQDAGRMGVQLHIPGRLHLPCFLFSLSVLRPAQRSGARRAGHQEKKGGCSVRPDTTGGPGKAVTHWGLVKPLLGGAWQNRYSVGPGKAVTRNERSTKEHQPGLVIGRHKKKEEKERTIRLTPPWRMQRRPPWRLPWRPPWRLPWRLDNNQKHPHTATGVGVGGFK